MEKIKLLEYLNHYEHSGSSRMDILIRELLTMTEKKINDIIEEVEILKETTEENNRIIEGLENVQPKKVELGLWD